MRISQLVAVLGLDETDAVRAVPLTDEELAARPRNTPKPPAERKHRKRRQLGAVARKG